MTNKIDFRKFAEELSLEGHGKNLLPVIEKELLHYEILGAMDRKGLSDELTFQGGTCLRLCYGSNRYSEDLDFVGGKNFDLQILTELKNTVTTAIERRYDVDVRVQEPSLLSVPQKEGVSVERWQVQIDTAPERSDIPQQRIKIEVALVDAHTKTVLPLVANYKGLPDGYSNILMICETLEEICADKLFALAVAPYIRYRDIWDLRWITRQAEFQSSNLSALLGKKIEDYEFSEDFSDFAAALCDNLPSIVSSKEFHVQMQRFLPLNTLEETIAKDKFKIHMNDTIISLYQKALHSII